MCYQKNKPSDENQKERKIKPFFRTSNQIRRVERRKERERERETDRGERWKGEGGERYPLRFKTRVTYFDNVASIVHWSQNTDTLKRAPMLQARL